LFLCLSTIIIIITFLNVMKQTNYKHTTWDTTNMITNNINYN